MLRQRCLLPRLGTGVAILAVEIRNHIVGTNVADVAVGELFPQLTLQVAVETHGHGTDTLPRDRVEPVAHLPMAVAAQHPALRTLPDGI